MKYNSTGWLRETVTDNGPCPLASATAPYCEAQHPHSFGTPGTLTHRKQVEMFLSAFVEAWMSWDEKGGRHGSLLNDLQQTLPFWLQPDERNNDSQRTPLRDDLLQNIADIHHAAYHSAWSIGMK